MRPDAITVRDNRRRRAACQPPQFGLVFQLSTDVFSVRLIGLILVQAPSIDSGPSAIL